MENVKTITDLYHVAGDETGMESTLDLSKNYDAKLYIQYKDQILVGELYKNPDGNGFFVNLICPRCRHQIKIDTSRKEMAYEPGTGIDIAPFRCTWELGERQGERIAFGLSMCNWTVGVKACWRPLDTSSGKIILTGIARDA